jgi:hypothetical protein
MQAQVNILGSNSSADAVCMLPPPSCTSQVHALGLLRFILTNLSHNGMMGTLAR